MTVDSIRAFPAVELFRQLATELLVDLRVNDSQMLIIAELCRQVDGVPLAIELAAVRVRLLGFAGFPLVANDDFLQFCQRQRTGPRRHESLAAAYQWSFDLLTEHERSALLRLCVLEGPFDLETALSVASSGAISAAEAAASIANLVSKSLIEHVDLGASTFRVLNLVRYFVSKTLISSQWAGNSSNGATRSNVVDTGKRVAKLSLLQA